MEWNFRKNKKGQTAIELAAFGTIIIFILGAIVRTALSSGYQQNQTLKALRMALSKSHLYTEGIIGTKGSFADGQASRNVASILVIEDRLTADSTKFGPIDRIPFILSSSASHSRNLFMPITKSTEFYHLPVFDLFVNGKHFPLKTSGFKTMCFAQDPGQCYCPPPGSSDKSDEWLNPNSAPKDFCGKTYPPHPGYWDNTCGSSGNSCPRFFTRIVNNPLEKRWCNDMPAGTPGAKACTSGNLIGKQRFDLDLRWTDDNTGGYGDNNINILPPGSPVGVPPGQIVVDPTTDPVISDYPRKNFSWQWYGIYGWDRSVKTIGKFSGSEDVKGMAVKVDSRVNAEADFDGDREEEQMIQILAHKGAVITRAVIMDSGEGDLDLTQLGNSGDEQVGLLPETSIETEVKPGTLLKIEEGKLFDSNNQFVRSVQKKDHIDYITRQLKLTKNTGRFCTEPGKAPDKIAFNDTDEANPIEWCGANDETCIRFHPRETCMSLTSKIIYIRSKPIDKRGRKWVTNISQDNYVNYNVPKVKQ
jgi:hypothetical protein